MFYNLFALCLVQRDANFEFRMMKFGIKFVTLNCGAFLYGCPRKVLTIPGVRWFR